MTAPTSRLLRLAVVGLLLTLATSAAADDKGDKGKKDKKPDAAVDAFFDEPTTPKKSSLDALTEASKGVVNKEQKTLAPKATTVDDEAKIQFFSVFAAEKIVMDKKLGCQPAGPEKKKLTFFSFDEVPAEGVPMSVCLTMQSKVGRSMAISVAIVDPRNARVVKAEDVVDFAGRTGRIDHVLDFPAPVFKVAGPYQYLVEMDGKEVARLPIFDVRVEAQ
jgi:hypothetical protein